MDYVEVFEHYCSQYINSLKLEREKGLNDFAWNVKKGKMMKEMASDIDKHLALVSKNIVRKAAAANYKNLDALPDAMTLVIVNSISRFGDSNK